MKYLRIILIITLLTSCKYAKNTDGSKIKDNKINPKEELQDKQKMEIRITCGKGSIDEFISKGWKVSKKYSEEKICSWKSVPANKNCDMEKDKGCKITKPDKIGEEIFYLLEK
tara:strand:- start:1315 stop:1653 length:339 start_codon:yes stop_codon:yes gene_type:complete